jgi:hypothetical protein
MVPAPKVHDIPLKNVEHFKEMEQVDEKNTSSISNLSPIPRSEDSFCAPFDEPSIDFSNTVRICKVQEPIIEVKEKEPVVESIYDCNPFTPSLKRDKPANTPAVKKISPVVQESKPSTPTVDKYTHTVAKELFIDFDHKESPQPEMMECEEEEGEFGSPDLGAMEEDDIIVEDEELIDSEEPKNIIKSLLLAEPTKEPEVLQEPKPATPVQNNSFHTSLEKVSEAEVSPPTKPRRKSMDKIIAEPPKGIVPEPILEKKSSTPVKSRSSNQFRKIQEQSPERSPALDYEAENLISSPTDIIPDFTALMTKASPNPYQRSPYKSKEKNNFEYDLTEKFDSQIKKKINFDDEHQKVEKKVQEEKKVEKIGEHKTKIKTRRRKETTEKVEPEKCNNENVPEENTKDVVPTNNNAAKTTTTLVKTRKGKKTEVKSSEILQEKQGTTIVKTRKNRVKK